MSGQKGVSRLQDEYDALVGSVQALDQCFEEIAADGVVTIDEVRAYLAQRMEVHLHKVELGRGLNAYGDAVDSAMTLLHTGAHTAWVERKVRERTEDYLALMTAPIEPVPDNLRYLVVATHGPQAA